jgi:parallel beta-helix repeat protein
MKFLTSKILLLACLFALAIVTQTTKATDSTDWSIAVLDELIAATPTNATTVEIGDMLVPLDYLKGWRNKLAGGPQPKLAFNNGFTAWTSGNVYYAFDSSVAATNQKVFLDCCAEWATFANLHFIQRTAQANYILVSNNPTLGGGQSAVGMIGGAQLLQLGPSAWSHATVCHEVGHALGLCHEHQRSDRDSFVTVYTNYATAGHAADFVLLTSSLNKGPYDFLSVMHYARNAFSTNTATNTIVPLPAYTQFLNIMGQRFDPVLSTNDRAGMAQVYGAGPTLSSVVTNTLDSGPGSLRAALYYAFDHPGTTITFNIPVTDSGYSNNVFNILPTDTLPGLWNATTLDATTEPINSNPSGPEILLNGVLTWTPSVFPSGLRFRGTNNTARGFTINNFPWCSGLFDGTNCTGNTLSACYLGVDPTGNFPVTNGLYPVQISGGAVGNMVGGVTTSARNIISGSTTRGVYITDLGTRSNTVVGNFIGLNALGSTAVSNLYAGVQITASANNNFIGPSNCISGNLVFGVLIGNCSNNVVRNNFIGLNSAGTAGIGNGGIGVWLFNGTQSNTVTGNVVSGNGNDGVRLDGSGVQGNVVSGNTIGLDVSGVSLVPNASAGIDLYYGPQFNQIGGNTPSARNVVSGNSGDGIFLAGSGTTQNWIAGNYIGLNPAGTAARPNGNSGIDLYNGASANVVGGIGGGRNFISGNNSYAVFIGFSSNGNLLQGNTIGLDALNSNSIPNAGPGVFIYSGANSNVIGGVTLGAANLISGNAGDGLQAVDSTNNTIRGNSIFNNSGLAITLYNGANNLLTAPTLSSAIVGTNTTVSGTYNGASGQAFQLDFYSDAAAQAQTYLGSIAVNGMGASSPFTAKLGALLTTGRNVTATATDPAGNTSQLSTSVAVSMTSSPNDGIPDAWRAKYFGGSGTTTNSQSASFADSDGDGMSNYQEFLAGTNPTNSASVFKLIAQNPVATTNAVALNSANGIVYRVLYRDDLAAGNWNILADQIIGTGTNIFLTDPAANSLTKRFYRGQVLW